MNHELATNILSVLESLDDMGHLHDRNGELYPDVRALMIVVNEYYPNIWIKDELERG